MRTVIAFTLAFTAPLAAQSAVARGAATITAADVSRRIGIIADDSMMGRDTPSRGLDLTARYVAGEFRRLGLKPAGDSGTYLQHYPLYRRQLDAAASTIVFSGDRTIPVFFAQDAMVLFGDAPAAPVGGPMVMLGGTPEPDRIPEDAVKGKVVVWPVDFSRALPGNAGMVLQALVGHGAKFLVIVSNRDTAVFAAERNARLTEQVSPGGSSEGGPLVLEVHEGVILAQVPEAQQMFADLRSADGTIIQPLDGWTARLDLKQKTLGTTQVPNTVAILEGSDPALRNEYVVYSAHMDHIGIQPGQPDSISNGADDDASGTAGIIELAEAFATRGARPKRSILFVAVSGEEKGLWGSSYFVEHPPVPTSSMVANFNLDMIGRNWKDTVVAIGMEHSDLGATLGRVAAANPGLGIQPIDDIWPEEGLYYRSDHFNFARKGVPVLFFTSGLHDDYHKVSDHPDLIDADKEARLLRLLYHLGQEVGNAPARPRWNPESYKEIVETGEAVP